MSVRQRRYEPTRSSRERDHRYDGGGERSRDRSDSSYNYKESVSEAGKSSGSSSSRHKSPLLQFTTDINPACFSGPITFPVVGGNRGSSSSYRSMEPYSPDSHTNEYSLDRKFGRRDGSHRSSYNDSVDDDRKIHRFRDNRERERDRIRERDRTRERERDRSRDRDSDRIERDRDRGREREWREEIPNNTIMIRCLDPTVSETDLRNEVTRYGLEPKDIRLIREKDTGASRGFAFVEFQLLSEAVRWKELTKSVVLFNGQHRATLHYSIPKDILGAERVLLNKADWDCTKCGMSNFRRRDYCFKCNSPREETSDGRHCEGYNEISSSPSNTLLFRNLDVLTTEERVLAMLGQLTTLPIKSLRVAKDSLTNTSRGFAFVELHSTTEATQLHDLLLTMTGNFYVDGRQVTVSYAKRSLTSMNSAASANAAVVALAAAQWTNQESECSPLSQFSPISEKDISQDLTVDSAGSSQTQLSSLGTVVVQGVTHKKYPLPDISTYQYDESSGFYYDNSTGLYYDANSQYYYNSDTQQYLYWDGEHHTFLAAQSTGLSSSSHIQSENVLASTSVSASSPDVNHDGESQDKSKRKEEKLDKVKIAKKIAKDMERWAKTLNQKKENAKLGIVASPFQEVLPTIFMMNDASKQSAAADAGFAILEKRTSLAERNALITEVLKHKEMENKLSFSVTTKEKPVLVASYGEDSDSGSEVDSIQEDKKGLKSNRSDESRLTDWSKLACLLCKRQFPTREALCRHQQLSDLHKKNLVKFSAAADQT